MLDAKGGGKGTRINAKAASFKKWDKVDQLLSQDNFGLDKMSLD